MTFWLISQTFRGSQACGYDRSMPYLVRAYLPDEWITVRGGRQAASDLGMLDY